MKKHVVIIGAGLAGMAAALELAQQSDTQITLLEERAYLGGRVHDLEINKVKVDVGGFIIYPWYTVFNKLINQLQLTSQLTPIPKLEIFFKLSRKTALIPEKDIAITLATKSLLAVKLFPTFVNNLTVSSPNLTVYDNHTVQSFLRNTLPVLKDLYLEKYLDTVCEGFCYSSIDKYSATFMFPMMASNLFFGDIKTAFYFPNGISTFIYALEQKLHKLGVEIITNSQVTTIAPHRVTTTTKTYKPDAIIVAHPLNDKITYTQFVTLTIACNTKPIIKDHASWGAIFLHRSICKEVKILSIINIHELYGKPLKNALTLNISLTKHQATPIISKKYTNQILAELQTIFSDVTKITITSLTHWKRTMPISNESHVASIIASQGQNDIYYAGDFLGCPSMETALATGVNAAKMVIDKFTKNS